MNIFRRIIRRRFAFTTINILFLIFCIPFFFTETNSESLARRHFLHMKGLVRSGSEPLAKTKVEIFTDSITRFSVTITDTAGWTEFKLPLQNSFTIKFMKYGYVTKKITVDTNVPDKMQHNYYCEFEAELFPQVQEIDLSVLKQPIANFYFNEKKKNFDYDAMASAKTNREIRSSYSRYRQVKRNENIAAKRNALK